MIIVFFYYYYSYFYLFLLFAGQFLLPIMILSCRLDCKIITFLQKNQIRVIHAQRKEKKIVRMKSDMKLLPTSLNDVAIFSPLFS